MSGESTRKRLEVEWIAPDTNHTLTPHPSPLCFHSGHVSRWLGLAGIVPVLHWPSVFIAGLVTAKGFIGWWPARHWSAGEEPGWEQENQLH